jgi:outer membrane protein
MIRSFPPQRQRLLRGWAGVWLLLAGVAAPVSALQAAPAAARIGDLLDVYTKALDSNPQYLAAIAGFHATAEVKPQALAKLLPQLGAGTSFGELEQAVSGQFFKDVLSTGTGDGINVNHRDQFYSAAYQVELQQVLFNWSLFKGYDKSDLQVGQAAVKVYEALDGLRLQTAQDYFDVLAAQDGVRFAKAEKDAIGDLTQSAIFSNRRRTSCLPDSSPTSKCSRCRPNMTCPMPP